MSYSQSFISKVRKKYKVRPYIDPKQEIIARADFIAEQILERKAQGAVVGISGGIDSAVVGGLVKIAIKNLNNDPNREYDYKFHSLYMPYGIRHDRDYALEMVEFLDPDEKYEMNMQPPVDILHEDILNKLGDRGVESHPFISFAAVAKNASLANLCRSENISRMMMATLNSWGLLTNSVVMGCHNAAEIFTFLGILWGTRCCDVAPLTDLSKRQISALASKLGVPEGVINRKPEGGLAVKNPKLTDEDIFGNGITYDEIDDFLEGKKLDVDVADRLMSMYAMRKRYGDREVETYIN
ncbi:NAD(+) synthase [Endozoicomonas sp. SM1973]|uniref:NH(3)-dependent NAD(+) synthetase n=1 Tax=Spartinivicinus marinus TaxID=2994442 RepID=A0A853I1T9_9GAMM|nr:NAD(+) synthase [Spartinivicinus marinus]MCX4026214.1 NAD(+) synthase [Spartinivicinus marinus]NYZ67373.1 NAD(+) synthase [Spartinivicinus marinus]